LFLRALSSAAFVALMMALELRVAWLTVSTPWVPWFWLILSRTTLARLK
jgi:hypothetical protein